jgi:hypothetical protein
MTRAGSLASVLLSSLWIGAVVFFGAVVARSAFRVLPTRTLAGELVGDTLPSLFVTGMLLGVVLVLAALPAGEAARAARIALGALTAVLCGVGQFVINARLHRIRSSLSTPIDALAPGDPLRAEFGRLHGMSVGALGLAMLASAIVVALVVASMWRTSR